MDEEIDLRQYLNVLWRRRHTIAVVTLAAVLAAGVFSFLSPPVYETKAMILVSKPSFQVGTPPDPSNPGLKIGAVLVSELPTETLVAYAKSPMITRKVVGKVSAGAVRNLTFAEELSAQVVRNTNLVELKVRGSDPERAVMIANKWAAVVTTQSESLFSTEVSNPTHSSTRG